MVRYRHSYDFDIVNCLVQFQEGGDIIFYSFTDVYEMISEKYRTIGKDTVQRHLNRLVKEHILVKLPKEYSSRRYNKTIYIVSPLGHKMVEDTRKEQQQQDKSS